MILSPYPQKVINSALLFLQVRVLIFLQRSQFQQCQFCLRMEGKISSAWTASSTVIHVSQMVYTSTSAQPSEKLV